LRAADSHGWSLVYLHVPDLSNPRPEALELLIDTRPVDH
jgi:hypothetical protein